jgi:hypothetical protein
VRGYVVTIKRADGSVLATIGADANTTSVTAPTLDDNQNYSAIVTAVDNTTGQPWASNSAEYGFRVDTTAEVTAVTPASETKLSGAAKGGKFTLTLDRPADPSTIASSVTLNRNPESTTGTMPTVSAGCASSSCTEIVVQPSGNLPEGRYTLSVSSGLKSGNGESTPFQPFSAVYAVAFLEDANGADPGGTVCPPVNQPATADATVTVNAAASGETGTLDFDWTYGSGPGWTAQALNGSNGNAPLGPAVTGGPGSGHAQLTFSIPQGSNSIIFRFTSLCSGGNTTKLDTSNLVGVRTP